MAKKHREPAWDAEFYDVGYRKPPVEYQFPKGVSGNPSGRPKSRDNNRSIEKILERLLNDLKVTIALDGKTKKVSVEEAALIQMLLTDARSGSIYSIEALKQHFLK